MIFVILILVLKILSACRVYFFPLPDRFPPETILAKFSYFIYLQLGKILTFLNLKIGLFPSKLIFFYQQVSVRIFFLKFPYLVLDILSCLFILGLLIKKQKNKKIIWLSLANIWFIFFLNSQRLSFKEELIKFLFKPYKLSIEEIVIFRYFFLIVLSQILYFLDIKKIILKLKKIFSKKRNKNFLMYVVAVLVVLTLLNCLGVIKKLSSREVSWKGFWIKPSGDIEIENLYFVFEKDFNLFFKPKKADIFMFCQENYTLFINGKFISRGGLISPQNYAYYDKWSAGEFLKAGRNSIRVECYNSFLDTLSLVKKKTALIFQLEASLGPLKSFVVSDDSWKFYQDFRYQQKVNFVSQTSGFQEFFDSKNKQEQARQTEIIDKSPLFPWTNLVSRPIPNLKEEEVLPLDRVGFGMFKETGSFDNLAEIISEGEKVFGGFFSRERLPFGVDKNNQFLLFDFGKIVVGYPNLQLFSKSGVEVDIGLAEVLKEDGTPDVAKMVSQADKLFFAGGEVDYDWRQRRAFRYAILIFKDFDSLVNFKKFSVVAVNYPSADEDSSFVSSDPLLNKIFETAKYTAKIARQGNFEDCPHREKAQYVGDMRIVSLVGYYNFKDNKLTAKALKEFALSQDKEGFINAVYPAGRKLIIPDYSAQWISSVWEYYLFTKDKSLLGDIYPFLKKQTEGFRKYENEDGLIRGQIKWWTFIDQGDQEENSDISISFNLFYLESLKNLAKISRELNKTEDEKEFLSLAGKVAESITKNAYNAKIGLYDDCLVGENPCRHFSRQTNVLALLNLDLLNTQSISGKILSDHSLPEIITPYFNTFAVESLFKNNYPGEAFGLLKNYWGGMVKKGATTFWETYDPATGRESGRYGESLSHGWSSGPAYLLPKWILGISPLKPGFEEFLVEPHFFGLGEVSADFPVGEGGQIKIKWSDNGNFFSIFYDFSAKMQLVLPDRSYQLPKLEQSENCQAQSGKVRCTFLSPGEFIFQTR